MVVVDAEDDAPTLLAAREDGTRWSGAWFVVRRGGAPVAVVEAGFDGADVIPADTVRALVDAAVVAHPGGQPGPSTPPVLPSASVVVPTNLARPGQLRTSLVALDALDHPDFEVVVVDNSRAG